MAESNGSLKAVNSFPHVNGKPNGQPLSRRKPSRKRQGFLAWIFGIVARLATWTAILTVLFRCPSSLEACDETSPYICKPYFELKNAVSPHLQPYYERYAAPYAELARPYYETVDSKIWTPTRAYAVQYGAPWVEKGRQQAWAQWEKNGRPQLVKFQDLAQEKYDQSVAPFVNQASKTVGPYYEIAQTNALQVFYEYLLPSYEFVQPYAVQGYDAVSDFTTQTALPTAYWAWNKTYVFLDSTVWPQLRVVYLENVEPQLVRIGERLGRYKTREQGKPIQESLFEGSPADTTRSSFSKPTPQSVSSSTSMTSKQSTAMKDPDPEKQTEEYVNPVQAPPKAENESEKRRKAREMVAEDLETWQNKFAAQADQGATELEDRVDEIAKRMIRRNAKTTGRDLVQKLESTIESELKDLKAKISTLVASSDGDMEKVEAEVVNAVRVSGMAIKTKAQAIRDWREEYDKELQHTVVSAADVHFEILDETRNLALQQIGMRWAWTDGVTYKDWAKYHELKNTLTQWTEQLKQLIVTHPTLLEAQDASAQVEDEGMEIASSAAKELARLKEVAHWKLLAQDATDNFDSEAMKLAAEAAESAQAAKDAVVEDAQVEVEDNEDPGSNVIADAEDATSYVVSAVEQVSSSAADSAAVISEAIEDQSIAASQSVSSILSAGADEVSKEANEFDSVSGAAESVASGASSLISESSGPLSITVEDAPLDFDESATDDEGPLVAEASEALKDAQNVASHETEEQVILNVDEDVEVEADPLTEREETPASESEPVKPVFLGAAAQAVPERQVVLEDYADTDIVASATDAAQAAYSNAVSRASEQFSSAVSVVSAQIYGTPKPVHEQLLSSVSAAYENAVAAANTKLDEAVSAASSGLQSTPTTTGLPTYVDWERVESIAAQRLNEGRLWAELQYQSAMIALGLATPTPSSSMEKLYEQAKFNYYAGLGIAQDRYSSFMAGASSALSSLTATPTPTDLAGSASSMASIARESAASAAQAAGDAAESAYNAASDTIASAAQAVDDSISSAVDAASEQILSIGEAIAESWGSAIAQISGQVYGEPTQIGWYDGILSDASSYAAAATNAAADGASSASDAAGSPAVTASAEASKQYSAVSDLISELIHGKEPTFTESVLSRLQAAYATAAANVESFASEASEAAASVGDKVGSAASQATEAVKETVKHMKDEL